MNRDRAAGTSPAAEVRVPRREAARPAGTLPAPAPTAAVPPPGGRVQKTPSRTKNGGRTQARHEVPLPHNALFVVRRGGTHHVIAESYFYKTEPYYTILALEAEGRTVRPASSAVLDAYVIPVCLERARAAGIPVCNWGISQAYVPLPALVYGLNYYATAGEYVAVKDNEAAKDAIRHVTHNGKYPFCFQKFPEGSEIATCTTVFGKTYGACRTLAGYAEAIYGLFGIPIVTTVWVKRGDSFALSSLSPVRFAGISAGERAALSACITHQESL